MKLLNFYLLIVFALLGCKDNDDIACYEIPPQTATLQIVDQENNNLIGENNIYPFDSIKITYNKEQVDIYLDSDSTVSFYYDDTPLNQQYLLFLNSEIPDTIDIVTQFIDGGECPGYHKINSFAFNDSTFTDSYYIYKIEKQQ